MPTTYTNTACNCINKASSMKNKPHSVVSSSMPLFPKCQEFIGSSWNSLCSSTTSHSSSHHWCIRFFTAVSNVSLRPRRVQLHQYSAVTSFHNHQSCCRSTNQDSVRTADLCCLSSRHLEYSSPCYSDHRLLPFFLAFAKTHLFHLAFN